MPKALANRQSFDVTMGLSLMRSTIPFLIISVTKANFSNWPSGGIIFLLGFSPDSVDSTSLLVERKLAITVNSLLSSNITCELQKVVTESSHLAKAWVLTMGGGEQSIMTMR